MLMKLTPFKCITKLDPNYVFVVQCMALDYDNYGDFIVRTVLDMQLYCISIISDKISSVYDPDVPGILKNEGAIPDELRLIVLKLWEQWHNGYDGYELSDTLYFSLKQGVYELLTVADKAKDDPAADVEVYYKVYTREDPQAAKIISSGIVARTLSMGTL